MNMTVALENRIRVQDFIAAELRYMDDREWDKWLAMFDEEVDFWVPAWDSEYELTTDPQAEISLMYYSGRSGLEDRVFRLRTGSSAASTPLPRTCHMLSNVQIAENEQGFSVTANWVSYAYRKGESTVFYGTYHYQILDDANGMRIGRKKIVVMNDLIPTVLDIYNL
jgi:3-phenylpropionate/cinnamic acid dioxygenase small subunit